MNVKYAILGVVLVLSTALAPSTVVAQEQQTEQQTESGSESDSLIPYEIQQILNQDASEVSQEDISTVQEWYSDNSDSLPNPVSDSVQSWLQQAQSQEPEYTGEEWESLAPTVYPFPDRWDDRVGVYHVEYDTEEGVARVYVETDEETTVVLADGTQTEPGAQIKTIRQVDGRAILSVQMRNPSNRHISVSAYRGTWLDWGEPNYNFFPNAQYRVAVLILGMIVVMGMMVALERLSNRHDQQPEREV